MALPGNIIAFLASVIYIAIQRVIAYIFAPPPPPPDTKPPYGRIAIIGAGLTGVSSAAHCIGHGFDVVLFEKAERTGGIWANVNKTSGLQLNSALYRFFPAVIWSCGFPKQTEILGNIDTIWKRYRLEDRTRFGYEVTNVTRHHSSGSPGKGGHARWVINDGAEGVFDAVIASVGTCGEPKMMRFPGIESFKGEHVHSSRLDGVDLEGKTVVSLGSGASGVEACELGVAKGAKECIILARSDKVRPPVLLSSMTRTDPVGTVDHPPQRRRLERPRTPALGSRDGHEQGARMAAQDVPLPRPQVARPDQEGPLSVASFHLPSRTSTLTRRSKDEGTPIVNERIMDDIREGTVKYLRGDIVEVVPEGVKFNLRKDAYSKSGDRGEETIIKADVIVSVRPACSPLPPLGSELTIAGQATGFQRPTHDFLPKDLFPVGPAGQSYDAPNLYLQTFATTDWSVRRPPPHSRKGR